MMRPNGGTLNPGLRGLGLSLARVIAEHMHVLSLARSLYSHIALLHLDVKMDTFKLLARQPDKIQFKWGKLAVDQPPSKESKVKSVLGKVVHSARAYHSFQSTR